MKKVVFLVGLLIALSGSGLAGGLIPPGSANCPTAPLSVYLSPGFMCTIGDPADGWTYFNWSFSAPLVAPHLDPRSQTATAADILLAPPSVVTDGFGFSSTKFEVWGDDIAYYIISYAIDPFPPSIPGFEVDMDLSTPADGGKATIATTVCAGFYIGALCEEQYLLPLIYDTDPANNVLVSNLSAAVKFVSPVSLVDVKHEILLEAEGGSSQISGMSSSVSDPGALVPEPASIILGGAGLGLILFLRKRPVV